MLQERRNIRYEDADQPHIQDRKRLTRMQQQRKETEVAVK